MVDNKRYKSYFKSPLGRLALEESGGQLAALLSVETSGRPGGKSGVSKSPIL